MEQYPSATTAYFQAYNLNRENAGLAVALVNSLYRMGASSPDYISEGIAICDTALFYNPGNRQLLRSKGLGLYIVKQFVQADSVYSSLLADGDSTYLTLKYGGASKYYAGLYMPSVDILDMAYEQDTTSVEYASYWVPPWVRRMTGSGLTTYLTGRKRDWNPIVSW